MSPSGVSGMRSARTADMAQTTDRIAFTRRLSRTILTDSFTAERLRRRVSCVFGSLRKVVKLLQVKRLSCALWRPTGQPARPP